MTRRTVLITGAARRIGAGLARDLHEYGMDVVVHYHRSADEAQQLVAQLNEKRTRSALAVRGDLRAFDACTDIFNEAFQYNQRLDVLVNNASSFYPTPVTEATPQQWQDLVSVNMQAPFFLSQKAAAALAERKGCIVNMTDIHAERPLKGYPVYSAAKAGLVMLTRALAKELGPAVRVNGLGLGAVLWPPDMDSAQQTAILGKTILQRTADPADVASALRFLIDGADYVTGQILTLDGGRTLYS